jgi:hypothetical protein
VIPWLVAAALAAPCDLDAPPDAPFGVGIEAERVRLVVEVWLSSGSAAWATSVLDTLDARGQPALVVVRLADLPVSDDLAAVLVRAAEGPHEVAVVLDERDVPRDILGNTRELKTRLKPLYQIVGRVRVVVAPIGNKGSEALLGRAGFRTLVNLDGPAVATPRYAGHFEGQPVVNVVLHAGPYEGPCGPDPRVGPFTPAAADRVATVLQRAERDSSPVVRLALDGSRRGEHDATVLGRWLDDIVLPGKVTLSTANDARLEALKDFRRGVDDAPPPEESLGGRRVPASDVRAAAEALRDVTLLPRSLPGGLGPTEAFYAFLLTLQATDAEAPVRIGALRGPGTLAETTMIGPVELSPDDVKRTAAALLAALPAEVPSALPVGDQLLTASELLLAMASVIRGDDPAVTHPVDVPEPNERGLGWGASELP